MPRLTRDARLVLVGAGWGVVLLLAVLAATLILSAMP